MANRFTDSRKWDDPWFRKLPCVYKAFWIFLLDKCNHAGIWKVDLESAEFHISAQLDKADLLRLFKDRIVDLGEKWFVPKFIFFQYQVGSLEELNPANRVHNSALAILRKEGALKGLKWSFKGCKDKDKDSLNKDTKFKVNKDTKYIEFMSIWTLYPNKDGKKEAYKHYLNTVITDQDRADIKKALANYLQSKKVKEGYIKNGSTWFNNWRDWVDYQPPAADPKIVPCPIHPGIGLRPGEECWKCKWEKEHNQ